MESNEDDLRLCIIRQLLTDGWKKSDIRLEIPMDTNSSSGRVDIVCLSDNYLGAIELKSGKDKFSEEEIKKQCRPYLRVFDYCGIVVDHIHHEVVTRKKNNSIWVDDNFSVVDLVYYHTPFHPEFSRFKVCASKEEKYCEGITKSLFRNSVSRTLSVYDMASVLWAGELREAFDNKATKSELVIHSRDNYGVVEFRKILLKALRGRPLNKWEESFWKKFDEIDWPIDKLRNALYSSKT